MKRISSGIPRLDTILGGGLPLGSLIVVAGSPGTGKTILAQQICFSNATPDRKAIYYSTISEPPEKFIAHLEVFDFFDRAALVDKIEFINLGDMLQSEDEGLEAMMNEIVRKVLNENPSIVVVDSAKALRDFTGDGRTLRAAVYQLASRIGHTDTTLLFVGEYSPDELESAPEFSLADGILELVYESHEPIDRRWLRVRKLRSSNHLSGKHPLQIGAGGIRLFVRAETLEERGKAQGDDAAGRIPTGVRGLDDMTHGGLPAGGSSLVLGPSGCGKTALALRFIAQGLETGERCLYITFQETPSQLMRKAASFGWDLKPYTESGQLKIFHVEEVSLDLDYIAGVVRDELAKGRLHRMVIDSLAEMVVAARESERFSAYARSLLGSLRAGGVSVLTTSETSSLGPTIELIGGLSFLYHNVILLRYIEHDSEVRRAVAIVKMRDSNHEKGLWAFTISEHGFEVQNKVEGVTGLLGWSALTAMKIE